MPDPTQSLRVAALRLLTRRDHSRAELRQKLASTVEDPSTLDAVLEQLESEHLLSDQRFASQRINSRGQRYGNARLAQELRQRGVSDDTIVDTLAAGDDELQRCRTVWQRKFGQQADSPAEHARQVRFLRYRGFSGDSIRRVMHNHEE